jgi:phage shock protein PspC (stress-responsive transcriptional regulator)
MRSRDGKLGGVCAGLARYLDVDVVLVRLVWLVLSIVPGAVVGGIIAYLAAWLLMPLDDHVPEPVTGRHLTLSNTDRKIAGVCGGLAEYFEVDATAVRLAWIVLSILFGACIGGVIAYIAAWMIMPYRHDIAPQTTAPATT